jgi:hypothetical protein
VGPGNGVGFGELIGVVMGVQGRDGEPPYVIRWYWDDSESVFSPDPERYWIRSHKVPRESRFANQALHGVESA